MPDVKILMILFPIWLATVLGSLYLGWTRPKAAKLVRALLERDCADEQSALSLRELGVTGAKALLGKGSSLRRVVHSTQEPRGGLASAAERGPEPRYYLPEEHRERAEAMYGKSKAGPWQALLGVVVLTAVFAALWVLGSLVLDTSGWQPLFRI